MTRIFTTQAVALSLAVLVTACTLLAINGLASPEQAAVQQIASAAAARA